MSASRKDFPDWETLYKTQKVETMPWYNENLDSDLEKKLAERKVLTDGKFLDLGTGRATQAMWLAETGFEAIGSDLSEAAISRAKKDDIINSKLKENEFDYVVVFTCSFTLRQKKIQQNKKNTES
jgi:2-polyprenyl-3-methyl-5-hydroxy-6-metoxy-1,4-benzoquinol methylase